MMWKDSRLRFQQLEEHFRRNELDIESIWTPKFQPDGTIFKELLEFHKNERSLSTLYAVLEGYGPSLVFDGREGQYSDFMF